MEQDTVTERIKLLVAEFADKPADFAKATGLTNQNVYDLTSGRKGGPSLASLKKILIAFPNVSERWVLLGEGGMLKSAEPTKNNVVYAAESAAPYAVTAEPRAYAVQEGENRGALLYNLPTAASYLGNGFSQERAEPDGIITMPTWLLKSGNYAVFPVIGDSMEPTFFAKDYVVCRFLQSADWEYLRDDTVAVIVTENRGLQLKRLRFRKGEADQGKYVRCISDNRTHDSYNIDLPELLEVWRFEWRITSNAINVTETLNERIARLEDGQDDLRRLVESIVDGKELRRFESLRNPMAQD